MYGKVMKDIPAAHQAGEQKGLSDRFNSDRDL